MKIVGRRKRGFPERVLLKRADYFVSKYLNSDKNGLLFAADNDPIISRSRLPTFYQDFRLCVTEYSPQYTLPDLRAIVPLCIQPRTFILVSCTKRRITVFISLSPSISLRFLFFFFSRYIRSWNRTINISLFIHTS